MSTLKEIDLVPWDAESPQHIGRLQSQRRQCGWSWDKVDGPWKESQRKGTKILYWIAFADEKERREDIATHIARYPEVSEESDVVLSRATNATQDREPLVDTAKTLRAQSRSATGRSFNPIGHISLDDDDAAARSLGLNLASRADGAFWIKCLYVSTTIQGGGVGRQAMDRVEEEATEAPLNARFLLLDTYHKDMFLREDLCKAIYGEVPKVSQCSIQRFRN